MHFKSNHGICLQCQICEHHSARTPKIGGPACFHREFKSNSNDWKCMRNFATVMSCFCEHIIVCDGCFSKENQRSSGNTNTVWTELPKVAPCRVPERYCMQQRALILKCQLFSLHSWSTNARCFYSQLEVECTVAEWDSNGDDAHRFARAIQSVVLFACESRRRKWMGSSSGVTMLDMCWVRPCSW